MRKNAKAISGDGEKTKDGKVLEAIGNGKRPEITQYKRLSAALKNRGRVAAVNVAFWQRNPRNPHTQIAPPEEAPLQIFLKCQWYHHQQQPDVETPRFKSNIYEKVWYTMVNSPTEKKKWPSRNKVNDRKIEKKCGQRAEASQKKGHGKQILYETLCGKDQ